MEAVPILHIWRHGTRFSRSSQPEPSAHTMSPPAPTATESPGRFCSMRPARTICRPAPQRRPTLARGRMRHGRHVLQVRVQRRHSGAHIHKKPQKRCAYQADGQTISASQVSVRLIGMFPPLRIMHPQLFALTVLMLSTPPLPVRNALAKRLFDNGAISPEDDWTFELIPPGNPGSPGRDRRRRGRT